MKGFATDIDEKSFSYHEKNISFKKADFNKGLPFEGGKFGLITCIEIIEHVENQFFLLRNLSDRLEKKGLLILSTPNTKNVFSRLLFLFTGRLINFTDKDLSIHINPVFDNIFLGRIIKDTGLKILKKRYSKAHIPFLGYLPLRNSFFGNNVIYVLSK